MMPGSFERMELPGAVVDIERGRVRMFARSIGHSDSVHDDLAVARAAGYPDLLVPPTFFFTVEIDQGDAFAFLADLGIGAQETVLHGEQRFSYAAPVFAGQQLRVARRVEGVSLKKEGALMMVECSTGFYREAVEVVRGTTILAVPRGRVVTST